MTGYPKPIIAAYASGEITREQFRILFHAWQKAHGIDYDCKGVAMRGFVSVTYRGVSATIRDGALFFIAGTDADGHRRHAGQRAKSFREFMRKVDFAIRERQRGAAWN